LNSEETKMKKLLLSLSFVAAAASSAHAECNMYGEHASDCVSERGARVVESWGEGTQVETYTNKAANWIRENTKQNPDRYRHDIPSVGSISQ
jgi:hypothetical protein